MNEKETTEKGGSQRSLLDGAGAIGINGSALESLKRSASPSVNVSNKKNSRKQKNHSSIFKSSSFIGNLNDLNKSLSRTYDNNPLVIPAGVDSLCTKGTKTKHSNKKPSSNKAAVATKLQPNANNVHSVMSDIQPPFGHNSELQELTIEERLKTKQSVKSGSSSESAKSGSASSSAGDSSSSCSESSSPESEPEAEQALEKAEEEQRQIQIAQLREKQKELREKVRKLKHANEEAASTKHATVNTTKGPQPMTLPKSLSACPSPTNTTKNAEGNSSSAAPLPTPAHSLLLHPVVASSSPASHSTPPPLHPLPPPLAPPPQDRISNSAVSTMQQMENSDASMPLDLCVKKADVASSSPALGHGIPQPLALTTHGITHTSTPLNSAASGQAKLNVSAIQGSSATSSRRRARKAKSGSMLPAALTSANHSDNRGARRKTTNDLSTPSPFAHGVPNPSFEGLSVMDILNASGGVGVGASSSNGRASGPMLLLPSPYGTCEGLRIPDITSRVNASLLSNLTHKPDLDVSFTNRSNKRRGHGTTGASGSSNSSSKPPSHNDSISIRSVVESLTSGRIGLASAAASVGQTTASASTVDHRNRAGMPDGISELLGLRTAANSAKEESGVRNDNILDSNSSSDSESSMGSGSESNSSANTERSAAASATSNTHMSGVKRHRHDRSDPNAKRKRVLPDDKEIRIPLEHGWRRQTRIRCFSRSGVKGEVFYYSPCGKKHRNYPEVSRYLQKNGITDIARDNFSFSSKVNIGEFVERLPGAGPEVNNCVMINEQEVIARIEEMRARKTMLSLQQQHRKLLPSSSASGGGGSGVSASQSSQSKHKELEDKQKKWEEIQMQRRLEQQAIARHNQELKAMRRSEQGHSVREAKRQRGHFLIAVEELKKQKDLQKLMKQQEKVEKVEHQRIEKEIRNQQLLEEREIKRQQSVMLREQEMQKRREMLLMVDLERERRRQHMMLVRALESRKKLEERDKKQKELIQEKEMHRLKKLEQRRMEMQLIREIKKPVDDMMLKDTTPLPLLNRIPGLKIPSRAFGDLIMVYEFLHNFGETLGFDMENLPSLSTLQLALLNYEDKHEEELLSVVHHLLVCAIDDPGISHPRSALTVLGQTLREVDITSTNVSEVLRLYIKAVDKRSGMCTWLAEKPFLSLNATKKAAILAFLCNELLCSKTVARQVDTTIDAVNTLKKDKWVVEGQLRRLKAVLQRRKQLAQAAENALKDEASAAAAAAKEEEDEDSKLGAMAAASGSQEKSGAKPKVPPPAKELEEEDDLLLDDTVNDSGNESDETQETGQPSDAEDEEPEISNEELEKKIEKLSRQQTLCQNKLLKSSNTLRGTTLGQDRYRRRYWILPKLGGIFVESLESAEILQTEEFPVETLEMRTEAQKLKETKMETDDEITDPIIKDEEKIIKTSESEEPESESELSNLLKKDRQIDKDGGTPGPKDIVKDEATLCPAKSDLKTPLKEPKLVKEEEDEEMDDDEVKIVIPDDAKLKGHDPLDFTKKKITEHMNNTGEDKKISNNAKDADLLLKDATDVVVVKKESSDPSKASSKSTTPLMAPPVDDKNNWLLHSPLFASILTGSLLMNGPLLHGRELNGSYLSGTHAPIKGASGTSTSHAAAAVAAAAAATSEVAFNPFMGLPSDFVTAEQIMKHFTDPSQSQQPQQKNWFSILPKLPCDNVSLASLPGQPKPIVIGTGITKPKAYTTPDTAETSITTTQTAEGAAPDVSTASAGTSVASTAVGTAVGTNDTKPPPTNASTTSTPSTTKPSPNPSSAATTSSVAVPTATATATATASASSVPVPPNATSATETLTETSPNIRHPLGGLFPPEATNKITASALANLQLGLLNGIPPGILMHSFMAAHGIGPLYQAGGNSPMGVMPPLQTPEPLQLAQVTGAVNADKTLLNCDKNNASEGSGTCSTPTGMLVDGCDQFGTQLDHPKRAMVERMQHDKPLPIPLEMQRGWWRITDMSQLKTLLGALHYRGIREKILQKYLEKYLSFTNSICSAKDNEAMDLEIIDLDRKISSNLGGAPEPDPDDYWLPEVALKVDLAILEQVENLEDKIAGASMQIKQDILNHPEQGWKIPPKLTADKAYLFRPACTFEHIFDLKPKKSPFKCLITRVEVEDKEVLDEDENPQDMESCDPDESTVLEDDDALVINEDIPLESIDVVDDSEETNMEVDDVPTPASSKSKESAMANDLKTSDDENEDVEVEYVPGKEMNPVEVSKTRLLKVESVIERRYIRPPLGTSTELNLGNLSATASTSQSYGPDEITPGLIKWRRAVENCYTSSQLALCINLLENCIAWDKSIMRASCQFCHSGDNEEMLLLCDGCDKGYHTYCFKPKMENIPDGDWYCYECLNKATGDKVCIMCGKKGNKMLECEGCPKTFHMSCLDPPIAKAPKGKWSCPGCSHKHPKKSGSSKSKQSKEKKEKDKEEKSAANNNNNNNNNNNTSTSAEKDASGGVKEETVSTPTTSSSSSKKSKSEGSASKSSSKEKKEKSHKALIMKDLTPATIIISELECHEDAWPFLLPVNHKQFPTYRKVIKKSMDLSTMKTKVEAGTYKSRDEFLNDGRLIFDNCETFNEDDSPVGIAGHNMRAFFECRWSELCATTGLT